MNTQPPNAKPTLRRGSRAFTLVEMLLVLVILATLAAIVYPKVVGRSKDAKITATKAQIASIKAALDSFEIDTGSYPQNLNDLVVRPQGVTTWHPAFDTLPKDSWQRDFVYVFPGRRNPNGFDLYSEGPPGEDSPIGNWPDEQQNNP